MKNATVLYCAHLATPDSVLKRAAEAAQDKNQHLAVLLYAAFPPLPVSAYGALPYGSISVPDNWTQMVNTARSELGGRVDAIEGLLGKIGVSADVRPLFIPLPDIKTGVAAAARSADFALFAPNLRENDVAFKELLQGLIFHSPISVLLNAPAPMDVNHITLAWNDSLPSARAAHLALPFLKSARDVRVVWFDPPAFATGGEREPGREVSAWLSHHGCTVTLEQVPTRGKEVGTCIIDLAKERGSDLIVMGAYGHSRMHQAVFGGTSRTLIDQTDVPVLLAH